MRRRTSLSLADAEPEPMQSTSRSPPPAPERRRPKVGELEYVPTEDDQPETQPTVTVEELPTAPRTRPSIEPPSSRIPPEKPPAFHFFLLFIYMIGFFSIIAGWGIVFQKSQVLGLFLLLLLVVNFYMIHQCCRRIYLYYRRIRLRRLPEHTLPIDGITTSYKPAGVIQMFELYFFCLKPKTVIPPLPLIRPLNHLQDPALSRYHHHYNNHMGTVDVDALDAVIARAIRNGSAPAYGSEEMRETRLLARTSLSAPIAAQPGLFSSMSIGRIRESLRRTPSQSSQASPLPRISTVSPLQMEERSPTPNIERLSPSMSPQTPEIKSSLPEKLTIDLGESSIMSLDLNHDNTNTIPASPSTIVVFDAHPMVSTDNLLRQGERESNMNL